MKIPSKFLDVLQNDSALHAGVLSVLSTMSPWFEDNKLVFFPEYTDHGPRHIEEVLETAQALITKESWSVINTEDVAVLVIGILLHDCAMHLSEDGFLNLITSESPINEGFGDHPWNEIWREFIAEAKRFDDRKLKNLFDDTEPIQIPPLDSLQFTKRDRLLIGDFLRRHHPRLAHEIALSGIPGSAGQRILLGNLPYGIRDIAGLIARSHGIPLRTSVDYLNAKSKWGARRTMGAHVSYLMTLVRIADYLQLQSGRAPRELLRVRALRSPVSRGEWSAHNAIIDIHQETDDPEAIWIEADPIDVRTYLKLRALLTDIQREMDDCWAVLGEVYGPQDELRTLGLTIRRIKSNLDDREKFAKKVSFVPYPAALDTSGAELLKLLISPLYGNKPEFGIRELLQNAVDACRELHDFIDQHPAIAKPQCPQQIADVVISLENKADGTKWLHVSDCGIGMSVKTILDYYLKAGASFRNSDAWRQQHQEQDGKLRVLRSGRFGIGVLAGFLLGDEIRVTTRHVTAGLDEGIAFDCRLDNDVIELKRIVRPVGTTVSIQLTEDAYSRLTKSSRAPAWADPEGGEQSWDWYCLDQPSVKRVVLHNGEMLKQRYVLPSHTSTLPGNWRRLSADGFDDIHWSYQATAPRLTCNGIIVSERNLDGDKKWETFSKPVLSVFDSRGTLPLNLQRTALTGGVSFDKALRREVHRDFLAYLLVNTPNKPPIHQGALQFYQRLNYPGLLLFLWYWCSPDGLSLLTPWHLKQLAVSKLIFVILDEAHHLKHMLKKGTRYCVVPIQPRDSDSTIATLISYSEPGRAYDAFGIHQVTGRRIIATRYEIEEVRRKLENRDDSYYGRNSSYDIFAHFREESLTKTWGVLCSDRELEEDMDLVSPFELPQKDLATLLVAYINLARENVNNSLTAAWNRTFELSYIPYNISVRKQLLAKAYKELAPYIQNWIEVKKESDSQYTHPSSPM